MTRWFEYGPTLLVSMACSSTETNNAYNSSCQQQLSASCSFTYVIGQ